MFVSLSLVPFSGSSLNATGDNCWIKLSSRNVDPHAMNMTSDGGSIISGQVLRHGGYMDGLIMKFDTYGTIQWQKYYYTEDDNVLTAIKETSDGGYICSGFSAQSVINYSSYIIEYPGSLLLKIDQDGWIEWYKTFDTSCISMIEQTMDGGFITIGSGTVMKLDSNGEVIWRKEVLVDNDFGSFRCIRQTSDTGYVVISSAVSANPEYHNFQTRLCKLDASGTVEWEKSYENPYQGTTCMSGVVFDASLSMKDIRQTSDGGYVMTGTVEASPLEEALYGDKDTDICVIKIDCVGDIEWCKTYGRSLYLYGEITDEGTSILETEQGDFYVIGRSKLSYEVFYGFTSFFEFETMPVTDTWIWLLKLNSNGKLLWARSYDDDCKNYDDIRNYYADNPVGMFINSSGGLTIAGNSTSYNSNHRLLLLNTDSAGNVCDTSLDVKKTKAVVKNYYPVVLDSMLIFEDDEYTPGSELEWTTGITGLTVEDL